MREQWKQFEICRRRNRGRNYQPKELHCFC